VVSDPPLITCQNPTCDYFMIEHDKQIRRNGHNSAGNQQYHCRHCNRYFIETKHTPLYHSRLDRSQVESLAKFSVEKNSIRSVARLTNLDRGTISRYFQIFGDHAELLNESHTVNISPGECELDEIWSFVRKKEKMRNFDDPPEYGDCWTFTAIMRISGFLLSFACGKRTNETCKRMFNDLYNIINLPFPDNKIIFMTDGNEQYENIIKSLYSETCIAYGKLIKEKKGNSLLKTRIEDVFGNIGNYKISTSVVEGYNNKIRQRSTAFVRKTAAFSKLLQSHIAKMNIFQFCNNFMELKWEWNGLQKVKERTPAMIEGIEDHLWTWREFLECPAVRIKIAQ